VRRIWLTSPAGSRRPIDCSSLTTFTRRTWPLLRLRPRLPIRRPKTTTNWPAAGRTGRAAHPRAGPQRRYAVRRGHARRLADSGRPPRRRAAHASLSCPAGTRHASCGCALPLMLDSDAKSGGRRVSSTTWSYLERETACRTRVLSEERGMRASGRQARGRRGACWAITWMRSGWSGSLIAWQRWPGHFSG